MYKLSKLAGSVIVATAALGGANAALADGYSAPKVRYERPSDWSGVYFGLHSGYQWSSIDGTFSGGGAGSFGVNYDAAVVGGHIGIQHQFGNVVLGVEGNFDSLFRDKAGSAQCPNPALNCNVSVDDILSVGGRAGWAAGHWMPYITGGYANAALHYNTSAKTFPFLSSEEARTRNGGWYLGGGVEWIVSPGWTVGLEYRHYEFDDTTATTFTTQPPQGQPIERLTQSATSDSIMSRVTWKFGRDYGTPLK